MYDAGRLGVVFEPQVASERMGYAMAEYTRLDHWTKDILALEGAAVGIVRGMGHVFEKTIRYQPPRYNRRPQGAILDSLQHNI